MISDIKLIKIDKQIKVPTRSVGGYKMEVLSESRYSVEKYEILSFYTPYYRNGHSAWDGNIERIEWHLMKDDDVIYTASSRQGHKKGTRKECVRALEYILKHGALPKHNSYELNRIENGEL